jgi:O-acetyl-ADP-ribose deacetylase (regulator of RNase III)
VLNFINGNIFSSKCDAIVNTVNCVGVMGKGLALQVKTLFPSVFEEYKKDCNNGNVKTGEILYYSTGKNDTKIIINFPTKQHWKDKSRLEWIDSGLKALRLILIELAPVSVAIPKLGCQNGGLEWPDVKKLIIDNLDKLPSYIKIDVYE